MSLSLVHWPANCHHSCLGKCRVLEVRCDTIGSYCSAFNGHSISAYLAIPTPVLAAAYF